MKFCWSNKNREKGIHLVNWEEVTRSIVGKKENGLKCGGTTMIFLNALIGMMHLIPEGGP